MDYKQFCIKYNKCLEAVADISQTFPWDNKEAYASWAANTHYYVKETSMMLALSATSLPPHHRKAANRFIRHSLEEMGHEHQLERDLKELGYQGPEDFEITNEMKICHRSLSYWGQQSQNAIGFMGWVLLIEGLAVKVGADLYTKINSSFKGKGTNFLRSHSDDDPDHLEKAHNLLKQLNKNDLLIVLDSIEMYTYQYISFLTNIQKKYSSLQVAA